MSPRSTALSILRRAAIGVGTVAMVVVGLSFVAFTAVGRTRMDAGQQRLERTKLDIGNFENAFKLYFARTGHHPDQATAFRALLDMQIIERAPKDAWGNDYRYALVSNRPDKASTR